MADLAFMDEATWVRRIAVDTMAEVTTAADTAVGITAEASEAELPSAEAEVDSEAEQRSEAAMAADFTVGAVPTVAGADRFPARVK
jgi:hypothetical protein